MPGLRLHSCRARLRGRCDCGIAGQKMSGDPNQAQTHVTLKVRLECAVHFEGLGWRGDVPVPDRTEKATAAGIFRTNQSPGASFPDAKLRKKRIENLLHI